MVDRRLGNSTRMAKAPGSSPGRSMFSRKFKFVDYNSKELLSDNMGVTKVKEKEKGEKKKIAKPAKKEKPREIKNIVRVAGTNLDGSKSIIQALKKIKGISHVMSKAICDVSGFSPYEKLGSLKEKDIEMLEKIINDPVKFGIPVYLLNRRKDRETGKDLHVVGADFEMNKKFDIQNMVNLKSYKGVRHMFGLPVRGQRTRSSFRKGKIVGVVKKSVRIKMEKGKEEKK